MFLIQEIKLKFHQKNELKRLFIKNNFKSLVCFFTLLLLFFSSPFHVKAANFSIKTGYYVGNGATQSISGVGFQPDAVIIKSSTNAGSGLFKTSVMDPVETAFFSASADDISGIFTLDTDGFSLTNNVNVNSENVIYYWVAFGGSDCTSTGTFCVGNYTGNTNSTQDIITGFGPAAVIVSGDSLVAANFRTASMPSNNGEYFTTTRSDTTGRLFTTLNIDGFTVGNRNNANNTQYHYLAFKAVTGVMAEGTYTGNGVDNTSITGFGSGSTPNFAFVKNTNRQQPLMSFSQAFGDSSSYMSTQTANVVNGIQLLQDDGIQIGNLTLVNQSGRTHYWVGFGGAVSDTASGTFRMDTGSYSGNGSTLDVTGLLFAPDLVIIKDNAANQSVYRTRMMKGDSTAYFASATANFTTGITSLNSDGFSIGGSAVVNTNGNTYHWQAFGNAWNPFNHVGSNEFAIGSYYGNGIDNRDIFSVPFQPSLITIKRDGATAGIFRTSNISGDLSAFFTATAETANNIQVINSDGFNIGTSANVNTSASNYNWFAFKNGANFTNNSYTGNGTSQNITTVGFQPDLVWSKRTTAVRGAFRPSSLTGNNTQLFLNVTNITNAITAFISNGFTINNAAEVNTSGGIYRYAAWRKPTTITVGTTGTQVPNLNLSTNNNYIGGAFTLIADTGTVNITMIKINETGTVVAKDNLSNLDLYYETSGTCVYDGTETLFGTSATFNNSEQATVTGSMSVGTSQVCVYAVLDVGSGASASQTIELEISNASNLTHSNGFVHSSSWPKAIAGTTTLQAGTVLLVDIVDINGDPVTSPSLSMSNANLAFNFQTSSGTFGNSNQKVRVTNDTATPSWTLSIASSGGSTSLWTAGTNFFDFNDPTSSAGDGPDSDTFGGRMTFDPSGGTINPKGGCNNTGLTLGSSASFSEGIIDSVTLLNASALAQTGCFWDLTGVNVTQTIPKEQPIGSYSINMTLTITAI